MFESVSELAAADPGPEVIAALAAVSGRQLDAAARVDLLVAWERQAAWLAAMTQPVLAAVGDDAQTAAERARVPGVPGVPVELPLRAAHAEIAAALRLSESVAGMRLVTARRLCGPLAMVQAALAAGRISIWHANAIVDSTLQLSDEQAARVGERVLARAGTQTVAQLRRSLRRLVLAVDPQAARKRAAQAKAERRLEWWALPDGMAQLRLIAPVTDVMAIYQAADTFAREAAKGHPVGAPGWLPIAARRADALVALAAGMLAATNQAVGAGALADSEFDRLLAAVRRRFSVTVNLTMDTATAVGLRDNPAELAGYGPLPAELARALAADGSWRRLIYEPHTGRLLDLGHRSYTPSAELTRYVQARDVCCGFPGCSRPAVRCHLDHTRRYDPSRPDGGRTDRCNLGPLCRWHHLLKHQAGWTLRRGPHTEQASWISPLGHRYDVPAHDYRPVEAVPEDPDAPDDWDLDDEYHLRIALADEPPIEFQDGYNPTTDGNWLNPNHPSQLRDKHIPVTVECERDLLDMESAA